MSVIYVTRDPMTMDQAKELLAADFEFSETSWGGIQVWTKDENPVIELAEGLTHVSGEVIVICDYDAADTAIKLLDMTAE